MDDNSDTDAVFLSFEIIFALLSVRSKSSSIGIEALSKWGSPKNMQLLKCPLEAPAVNQSTDAQVNVVTNTCLVSRANVLLHNSCTGDRFSFITHFSSRLCPSFIYSLYPVAWTNATQFCFHHKFAAAAKHRPTLWLSPSLLSIWTCS